MSDDARGAVAPLATLALLALMLVALAVGVVGGAVVAQRRVETAADLAALAGAAAAQSGGDPCRAALSSAQRNLAVVSRCSVSGGNVEVELSLETPTLLGRQLHAEARARAGP